MKESKEKVAFSLKINLTSNSEESVGEIKDRLNQAVGPLFFSKSRPSADFGVHFFADGVLEVDRD